MKKTPLMIKLLTLSLLGVNSNVIHSKTILPANGINYPVNLKNWQVLASSYRTDNNTQRIILGNSTAINAARSGQTKPWPKGSILAKLVWKNKTLPHWKAALVPGEFVHTEIMVKDLQRYKSTQGWGYARWLGESLKPYIKNESSDQSCDSCHTLAKDNDYVFTLPVTIP